MSNSGCSCGSSCKCGSGCSCEMHVDVEKSSTITVVEGFAPLKMYVEEGSEEISFGGEGCSCGSSCKCNPCTC